MSRERSDHGSSISRLVWVLAGLALCAGGLTHALQFRALAKIRDQRERTKQFERRALSSFRSLQSMRESVFLEIEAFFEDECTNAQQVGNTPSSLGPLLERCNSVLADFGDHKPIPLSSTAPMTEVIATLSLIHGKLNDYCEQRVRNRGMLADAWQRVQQSLDEMQEATQRLDGRRRLRQEILLRKIRNAGEDESATLAMRYIDKLGNGGGLRIVISELSDIELLASRLYGSNDPDQLVSLKDNEMRQTLARLMRAAGRADEDHDSGLTFLVDAIQTSLFGEGSIDDPAHQTLIVGDDGLYTMQHQRLGLAQTGQRLRTALGRTLAECLDAERGLDRTLLTAINDASRASETTLGTTFRDSLIVGLLVTFTFVALSWKIARLGRVAELRLRSKNDEIKQAMEQLSVAKRGAEAANRSKSEFLANMSHEIRTPMTAILGFTEALLDPGLSSAQKHDAIHTIRRNGEHLLQVINDILDMSKIEAGKMTVERIPTSPAQIVEEVASLMRPRLHNKGLSLSVQYDTPIPESFESDPTRLRQILLNLVSNAMKFTDMGGVTIHAGCSPDQKQMRFRVVDTGTGMTREQVKSIAQFDAFNQADGSTTRKYGGTGLGLRISNSLATLLGGGIEIESRVNEGSEFIVKIATGDLSRSRMIRPDQVPSLAELNSGIRRSNDPDSRPLDGVHILLAEDGPDNQRLISHFLVKAGAEVTIAINGRVAVDLVEESTHSKIDIILMDMQMPEMDGYEASRRLRANGHHIPIVALTAHAMAGDRQKCLDAGCDDYVTKPIDRVTLIRTCNTWARRGAVAVST